MLLGSATIRATHTVDVSKTTAKADVRGQDGDRRGRRDQRHPRVEHARRARSEHRAHLRLGHRQNDHEQRHEGRGQRVGCQRRLDSDADTKANKQVSDNPNTGSLGVGTLPSANASTSEGNSQSSSETGSEGGGVGVAAAISVNWLDTTNTAESLVAPP